MCAFFKKFVKKNVFIKKILMNLINNIYTYIKKYREIEIKYYI